MSTSQSVTLRRVDHTERADLDRLVDAYLGELNTHREQPVGPVDADSYMYLPLYWQESGRHPFFILDDGTLAGFVFVREVQAEAVIEMSDFYIRPDTRRREVGRRALASVWDRFPGRWRLQVHPRNRAASTFWPRLISEFATGKIESREVIEEDGDRREFVFEIPPTRAPVEDLP